MSGKNLNDITFTTIDGWPLSLECCFPESMELQEKLTEMQRRFDERTLKRAQALNKYKI
jgi:hypothetical protein